MRPLLLLLSTTACGVLGSGPETDTDPPPPPITGRFVADAYLQDCRWTEQDWLGVRALQLTLHHSLGELDPITLPEPGSCISNLDLFAEEALPAGDPIPDLPGRPGFSSPEADGTLAPLSPGLWHDDAFVSPERCGTLQESVGDGAVLTSAGPFSDLRSPGTGTWTQALADGERFIDHDPVQPGDEVALTWDAEGWSGAFVQVRRMHEGEVRETLTCGVSGSAFTIDDAVWDAANPALLADENQIYLSLYRDELVETVDGSAQAWMLLRAIHVLEP